MKRLVVLLTALAACGDDPAGRGDRTTDTSGDAPDAAEVRPDDDIDEASDGSDGDAPTDTTEAMTDADTDSPPDVPDAPDGSGAPETTDASDANEIETTTAECDDDNDCADRAGDAPCIDAVCREGTCVVLPATGRLCDDDDPCTTGGLCESGVCKPSGQLECPALSPTEPCWVGGCVPGEGCGRLPAVVGSACDNGTGPAPGSCRADGRQAPDLCDGHGTCVDATTPAPPEDGASLAGSWFTVSTAFGRAGVPATARAVLDVADAATFEVRAVEATGPSPFVEGAEGNYCAADDGALVTLLAPGRMDGQVLERTLAVVSDPASDQVAIALRADGTSSTQIDGNYVYFQTSMVFGGTAMTTWIGAVTFRQGCLVSGTTLTNAAVAPTYDFVTTAGDCLTAQTGEEAGLYRLSTHARAQSGDTTSYPIDLRGAIGAGGEVLLMVKEVTGTRRPELGLVMMLRAPAGTSTLGEAPFGGDWSYTLQAQLGGDLPRRDRGVITWDDDGALSDGALVTLDGPGAEIGGWYLVEASRQAWSQRLDLGGLRLYQTGFGALGGRFQVGWLARAPADGAAPVALDKVPAWGSTVFMLRR